MSEQPNNSSAAFMEVVSKKMESHDKKIALVEEKIKTNEGNPELLQQILYRLDELSENAKPGNFPVDKVNDFSSKLDFGISLLKAPVQNKVLHHHHVPKLIWISAGLFIAFSLLCAAWYNTSKNLESYIASDTKYRYLRLDTSFKKLQLFLDEADSLYINKPDFRNAMLAAEEQNRLNFERLQKAERLKAEAKDLENSIHKK